MYYANNYEAPTLSQLAESIVSHLIGTNNDVTLDDLPKIESLYYNFGHNDHDLTGKAIGMFIVECERMIRANRYERYLNGEILWTEI